MSLHFYLQANVSDRHFIKHIKNVLFFIIYYEKLVAIT